MKETKPQDFFVATYLIIFLAGFCGNVTVFVFLVKLLLKPTNFHKVLCLILLNLAVADLLTEFFGSAAILINNFVEYLPNHVNDTLCKSIGSFTLLWIFANISKFHLCFLAWERYRAATKPLSKSNMKQTMITLLGGWVGGALIYIPFVPYQIFKDGYCIEKFSNHSIGIIIIVMDLLLTFMLPFTFVFSTYYGIIKAIRKRVQNSAFSTAVPQRVTRISMLIIISYLLCWAPNYLFYAIAVILSKQGHDFDLAMKITYIPAFAASASHPLIYAVLSKAYRDNLIKLYRDFCGYCKSTFLWTRQDNLGSTKSVKKKINTVDIMAPGQSYTWNETVFRRVQFLFSTTQGTRESSDFTASKSFTVT